MEIIMVTLHRIRVEIPRDIFARIPKGIIRIISTAIGARRYRVIHPRIPI
jgi:hypothetical protein